MSEKSEGENEEVSGTTKRSVESSPLELTVKNVQRLQKEWEGLDRLYGSSQSIEGYIKNTEHLLTGTSQRSRNGRHFIRLMMGLLPNNNSNNNCLSTSPECVDILGLDGTVITRMNQSTQTDWRWVSKRQNHISRYVCSQTEGHVPKHEKKLPLKHEEHKGPDTERVSMEIIRNNEEAVTGSRDSQVTPQAERLTGKFDKITTLTPSSDSSVTLRESEVPNFLCEYCQQVKKPQVTREKLKETAEPEKLFCCDIMWTMADLYLREEEEEEEEEEGEKATKHVNFAKINDEKPHSLAKTESQEIIEQRHFKYLTDCCLYALSLTSLILNIIGAKIIPKGTISYRLSNVLWNSQQESQLPEMEIITPPETLTLPDKDEGVRRKNILIRYHRNGKTFVLIFPDGTGHVFYPSGHVAVLISSAHPGHFIYVILQDAPLLPRIQAIFTSRGQATCYHPNGNVCVSLTPVGGIWCSETGALKRRWSWFDLSIHVHAPPFQPITMTLSPNISIRICTQQNICLTFTADINSVRFNMGTKLKMENKKGLMLPGPDILESYLEKKTLEILCLLQRLQGSMSLRRSDNGQIKSQYSLLAQSKRLSEWAKKEKSSKKTKVPQIFKQMKLFSCTGKGGF
ncbi:hypothetical protein ACEWY4_023520 [Coilia grayii]|uniref:FAM194 C-terminal domain-containing protein n=1 Tax=Coilia grayii TaxID=363190 RepID=A0ABD1J3B6_9TELE